MISLFLLVQRASALPIALACGALFFMMLLTFCDVIFRSVFNAPIEAATELTRILMAVLVFSVLPIISIRKGHIAVDLTDGIFRRFRLDRLRDGLLFVSSGVILIWPAKRVWILAERARDYGDLTEYLSIPVFLVAWFITLAVALSAIAMIVTGLLHLFAPKLIAEIDR